MKSLLTLGLLVTISISSTFAQRKLTAVDSLIKNRNFVFVVTKLKQKPGYFGPQPLLTSNINSTYSVVTSVSQAEATTSIALKDTWEQMAFYSNNGSQNYFDAYGIPTKRGKVDPVFNATANIFIIQYPDQLMIKDIPTSLIDIQTDALSAYSNGVFKITELKKKDKKWMLTYVLLNGEETQTRKYYMEVSDDGKAVFRTTPDANYTTYLYGFVVSTNQLKKQ
jgi:hypothetical protein